MAVQSDIELSIVLPAYHESESLASLLPALRIEAERLTPSFEILVVDSLAPFDDSEQICERNGALHIRRGGGERYGDAVRTGISRARGRWLLFMDADGSHPPSIVLSLWERRNDGDVIIGSRYVKGGSTGNSSLLVGMSLLLNVIFRVVFSLPCRDVTNSLRLYRGDAVRELTLQSDNFDILQEILIKIAARRPRPSIIEVPMGFLERTAGESKRKLIPFIIAYLRTIARLWRYRKAS